MQRERQKYQQDQELPVTTHKNTGYDVNAGSETNIRVGGEINTTDGVKMDGFVPLNGKTEKTTGFSVGGPVAVTPGGIPLSANTSYTSTTVTYPSGELHLDTCYAFQEFCV